MSPGACPPCILLSMSMLYSLLAAISQMAQHFWFAFWLIAYSDHRSSLYRNHFQLQCVVKREFVGWNLVGWICVFFFTYTTIISANWMQICLQILYLYLHLCLCYLVTWKIPITFMKCYYQTWDLKPVLSCSSKRWDYYTRAFSRDVFSPLFLVLILSQCFDFGLNFSYALCCYWLSMELYKHQASNTRSVPVSDFPY